MTEIIRGPGVGTSVDASEIDTDAVGADEIAASGVTAATYGSATQVGQFTVDEDGRITAASNVAITAQGAAPFGGASGGRVSAGGTAFIPIYGVDVLNTGTEDLSEVIMPVAGTIGDFRVRTQDIAQPADGALTITVRLNGADTTIVITIAGGSATGTTGTDADTVAVVAGDRVCIELTNAATSVSSRVSFGGTVTPS